MDPQICCPPFDPASYQEKTITFDKKPFVKDRVFSFFHIPLNFGSVMTRVDQKITAAGAKLEKDFLLLVDENSFFGADVYVAVAKNVPAANNTELSGTFLTKVYEGGYQEMGNWIKDMHTYVQTQGKQVQKLYFYYTTCPKCAKKYGKNYVVLFAQVA